MENEKFITYYVEILNNNLYDAISKNVVFQAKEKIKDERIKELEQLIQKLNENEVASQEQVSKAERLNSLIESLNSEVENKARENSNLKNLLNNKESELSTLNEQIKLSEEKILSLEKMIAKINSKPVEIKKQNQAKPNTVINTKTEKEIKDPFRF